MNTISRMLLSCVLVMIISTISLLAQSGCSLFTKSFSFDETKFYTGNGLVNVYGDFTAYSNSGKRFAMIKVSLVDAMNQLHCKNCDTSWHQTSGLFINGTLNPNPNNPESLEGIVQNGSRPGTNKKKYRKGSKFSDYSIIWGDSDSGKYNPILNEGLFALDMYIQFDSPTDSIYSTIQFSLNYEFTDTEGNRCDTTISYSINSVYVEAPFNSEYTERLIQGVKIKTALNRRENLKDLLKLSPIANSDNKFSLKFAWRKSDMKIDQIVIDNSVLSDKTFYVTKAIVVKDNVAVEYYGDTSNKIFIPVEDLVIKPWDPSIDTSIYSTFEVELLCEEWKSGAPNDLNTAISFHYTPNHSSKKTFKTPFKNYQFIRPSKVGDKGLSESVIDPRPKNVKAFMLSFMNENPTKSPVYSIDLLPVDKEVKILGLGNMKDENSNGGITAWINVGPEYCIPCVRSRNPNNPYEVGEIVDGTMHWTSLGTLNPILFAWDACCYKRAYGEIEYTPWRDVDLFNVISIEEDSENPMPPVIGDDAYSLNPNIDVSAMVPIQYGEKPRPMILFFSNAETTVPIKFAARNISGQIVSKGVITLENMVSAIELDDSSTPASGLSPNPATEGTTLNFTLQHDAKDVTITVTDIQGRVVKTLADNAYLQAGSQAFYFETNSLMSGTYIVKISAKGISNTTKLTVTR